jgi:MFS family permease
MGSVTLAATIPWYRTINRTQWKTLFAAQAGWMLDGMDIMLYAFALTAIQQEFGLSPAIAGSLASLTLIASAVGGSFAGVLADKYGRARMLVYSILLYSIFTGLTATATSVATLALWRALVGLGLGAEWSAGSVLIAETWPAEHRCKAVGLTQSGWAIGYLLAALLAALILPKYGWRPLFLVGALPALLTVWIRRNIPEPQIWIQTKHRERASSGRTLRIGAILRPPLLRRTVIATLLCTTLLCAYWGLFTWIPAYLSSPLSNGGLGLGIVKSSGWIIPVQIGAFFGYLFFGVMADRFGRRPVLLVFVLGAAVLVPFYALAGRYQGVLLLLGPLIGFFGHGYFSVFGAMLAELFPSSIRGAAQGMTYNSGRAVSALAPFLIGAVAGRFGIGGALAFTSIFYLVAGFLVLFLPETKGEALE